MKYYIFNLLRLFTFTRETNIRTMPDHSSYITIIPQYTEGNHYSAVNGDLHFGNATFFVKSGSFFVIERNSHQEVALKFEDEV